MTAPVVEADVLERRARVVSAALRAAYAWSARDRHSEAFAEVARMTGVIMFELGPGSGPAMPIDLVRCLHEPLAGLLRGMPAGLDPEVGPSVERVRLLADGALTHDAYEVGSDFVREVIGGRDPGQDWLPSWSWMRAEDVERQMFTKLIAGSSADAYRTTRQFLIEHPAGLSHALAQACNDMGAERVARYVTIPDNRIWSASDGAWWWPCPVCRWPMVVDGTLLRCRCRHHQATFQIARQSTRPPRLIEIDPPARRDQRRPVPVDAGRVGRHSGRGTGVAVHRGSRRQRVAYRAGADQGRRDGGALSAARPLRPGHRGRGSALGCGREGTRHR